MESLKLKFFKSTISAHQIAKTRMCRVYIENSMTNKETKRNSGIFSSPMRNTKTKKKKKKKKKKKNKKKKKEALASQSP